MIDKKGANFKEITLFFVWRYPSGCNSHNQITLCQSVAILRYPQTIQSLCWLATLYSIHNFDFDFLPMIPDAMTASFTLDIMYKTIHQNWLTSGFSMILAFYNHSRACCKMTHELHLSTNIVSSLPRNVLKNYRL